MRIEPTHPTDRYLLIPFLKVRQGVTKSWTPRDTTTHQDHVIAHIVGTTIRGYFVFEEALYLLLDMGFVWTIFLDGEMSLLPHPVAINELAIDEESRQEINADITRLLGDNPSGEKLLRINAPPAECLIEEVGFFERGEQRRLLLKGEEANLKIETSLNTAEIVIMSSENDAADDVEATSGLKDAAETEHQYLHERLRAELGREPSEEELDEWLRQHTEGY